MPADSAFIKATLVLDIDTTRQFTISVPSNEDVNLNDFIDDYFGIGRMAILIAGYDNNFKKTIVFNKWSDKLVFNKGQIIYAYVSPVAHISSLLISKPIIYYWLTLSLTHIKDDNRPFIYDYINIYTCLPTTHSNRSYCQTWGDSISYNSYYQHGLFLPYDEFISSETTIGILTASGGQYIIGRVEADDKNGVTFIEHKAERDYYPDLLYGLYFRSIYQSNIEMKKGA